jgi:hypothetical protein
MHVGVTATGVLEVYAKALENFAARRQCPLPCNLHELAELAIASDVTSERGRSESEVPLNGFPRAIHRRVKMLESLAFSEHLMLYHRQRGVAVKMIAREWFANPVSVWPARVLLRRLLPVSLVARVVRIKNRTQGVPPPVADFASIKKA